MAPKAIFQGPSISNRPFALSSSSLTKRQQEQQQRETHCCGKPVGASGSGILSWLTSSVGRAYSEVNVSAGTTGDRRLGGFGRGSVLDWGGAKAPTSPYRPLFRSEAAVMTGCGCRRSGPALQPAPGPTGQKSPHLISSSSSSSQQRFKATLLKATTTFGLKDNPYCSGQLAFFMPLPKTATTTNEVLRSSFSRCFHQREQRSPHL